MPSAKKKPVLIIALIVAILVIIAIGAPRMINVNRYRAQAAARIEQATGKPAQIGRMSLSVFPRLAIEVSDFSLGNPKNFPAGDFIKAKRLFADLNVRALLQRRIEIDSVVLENPEVHLLSNADGHWNFENPSAPPPAAPPTTRPSKGQNYLPQKISEVKISSGLVTMANLLPSGSLGPVFFEGRNLSCRFQDIDLTRLPSFASAAASHLQDVLPASFWQITSVSYAEDLSPAPLAHGSFDADSLRFGAIEVTSVEAQTRVLPKQVLVDDLTFHLADGSAKGKGSADFSGPDLTYSFNTVFQGVDMAKLVQAFPQAQGKITGTMDGNLDLTGTARHSSDPLSDLKGTGQVNVRKGRLPSLALGQNLCALARLAGIGPASGDPSAFSLISSDLNLANQRLTSHDIKVVGEGLSLDASGNVALVGPGQMDYTGVARIAAKQTGVTSILAGLSGAKFENGQLAFPFDLRGTFQNPRFALKPARGLQGGFPLPTPASSPQSGKSIMQSFGGLFSKKPAPKAPKQ